jgi:Flp pilus assembly protein TadD
VPASLRARVGLHRLDLLLDEGDGHAALTLAESLAHGTTVRAALGNRLGLARSAVGDVAGARAAFEAAHQSDPRDASALINLARIARTAGDREGARRLLQQALALDETNGEAWLAYGVVLTDLGALVEARRAVLEAGRRMPDQAGPWTTQGEIDLREGHPAEAAASFREALQRAPDDTGARTNLGVALADSLTDRGLVALSADGGEVTDPGHAFLREFGAEPVPGRRVFCRPCLDWSERRPHIAGRLGAALAHRCFELGWVARMRDTRAVAVTDAGRTGFQARFGVTLPG